MQLEEQEVGRRAGGSKRRERKEGLSVCVHVRVCACEERERENE